MLRARDNPFAAHRVLAERYRLDEVDWSFLLKRLASLDYRAALVGPHGSGKTTLLEDLAARLGRQGWRAHFIRLSREHQRLPSSCDRGVFKNLGPKDFLLLDGAEQLSLISWCLFRYRSRRAGGLVITTHRTGRLRTLRQCETSPQLLQELVLSLGESLSSEEAVALHVRHRGNVREALRSLYDLRASA